ncbi:MAG: hypothetical protein QNJ77_08685 [Acidimicrobiia bacterium]|nr:hypothetical protein [Acidimicrobiia bacterium]
MVPTRTMEVAVYQVADVVTVGDHGVATVVAVRVVSCVLVAVVLGCAAVGIVRIDRQCVLVDAAGGDMPSCHLVGHRLPFDYRPG